MNKITFNNFLAEVKRFNQKALYILQIPVNLSKTVEKDSVVSNSIERIWAICPHKRIIYTETFLINGCDNLQDLSYIQFSELVTEEELAQILMQLKSNMYDISYNEYELLYNTKVKRPKEILAKFYNEHLQEQIVKIEGYSAKCYLHEWDHLQGVTFKDRVSKIKWDMATKKARKLEKQFA